MKVEICEETYQNLKHCIERTEHMWEPFTDLWPFEIMDIIKQYETTWQSTDIKSHVLPPIYSDKYQLTNNPWLTDDTIRCLFSAVCTKCGSGNMTLTLGLRSNSYHLECKCGNTMSCIIG